MTINNNEWEHLFVDVFGASYTLDFTVTSL